MSAKRVSDFVASVTSHIGNRAGGYIGSSSVADAILDSLNSGLYDISSMTDPLALQRKATIAVTASAYSYAEPILDTNTLAISIKNYISVTQLKSGETIGYPVRRLDAKQRDRLHPITSASIVTGRPQYYTRYNGYLEFWPYPDGAYTIYLRVNVHPTDMDATANTANPLGEFWDKALEAYAIFDIFAKLQQTTDASSWYTLYSRYVTQAIRVDRRDPDDARDINTTSGYHDSAPWNNPLVYMDITE